MESREQLEKRVARMEQQLAALGQGRAAVRGIRKRASWGFGDLPFYDIAVGPDLERVALGGGAVGHYACGGGAAGEYVVSATRRDPEAQAFFH